MHKTSNELETSFAKKAPQAGRASTNFFAFAISNHKKSNYLSRLKKPEPAPEAEKIPRNEFISSFGLLVGASMLMAFLFWFFGPKSRFSMPKFFSDSSAQLAANATKHNFAKATGSKNQEKKALLSGTYPGTTRIDEDSNRIAPTAKSKSPTKPSSIDHEKLAFDLEKAMDLVDSGKPEEARELLEAILEKDPDNSKALAEMGRIHVLDFGDNQGGFEYLKRSVSADPSDAFVVKEYASLCATLGRGDSCLDFLNGLEKNASETQQLAIAQGKGQILMEEKRYTEAIPHLESAISMSGANPQSLSDLAQAYKESGQSTKAIDALEAAAEKEKDLRREGFYDGDPDLGDENYVARQLELINELERQGKKEAAHAQLEKLRSNSGIPKGKLASILSKYDDKPQETRTE